MLLEHEKLFTIEEFWRAVLAPENEEHRLEWEDGEIVDVGSSSRLNTVIAIRIATFLNVYVMAGKLGYVTGADAGYYLAGFKRLRRPDTAFISRSRAETLDGVAFDGAPDLAVEVVSPDEDVFRKANEYLRSGTKIVWAVYTDERVIYVMTLNEQGAVISQPFGMEDTLDGGAALPGFTLPVRDVFAL